MTNYMKIFKRILGFAIIYQPIGIWFGWYYSNPWEPFSTYTPFYIAYFAPLGVIMASLGFMLIIYWCFN